MAICNKPHSLYPNYRCNKEVDPKTKTHIGWCTCVLVSPKVSQEFKDGFWAGMIATLLLVGMWFILNPSTHG